MYAPSPTRTSPPRRHGFNLAKGHKTSRSPTTTDDISQGFRHMSNWLDDSANELWVCLDPTKNAAVWARLAGAAGVGEVNTASNVGGYSDVFKQKTGVDLEFRTLQGTGSGLTLTQNLNDIEFALHQYLQDIAGLSPSTGDLIRWNGANWVNYPDSNYAPASALGDYVKRDGTTTLTADWDVGDYALNNVNRIGIGTSAATSSAFHAQSDGTTANHVLTDLTMYQYHNDANANFYQYRQTGGVNQAYTRWYTSANGTNIYSRTLVSGANVLNLDSTVADGTSDCHLRTLRSTNTTGAAYWTIHRGDGTSSASHRLYGHGGSSYLANAWTALGEGLAIGGTTVTSGYLLDVHDDAYFQADVDVSGFITQDGGKSVLDTDHVPWIGSHTGNPYAWCGIDASGNSTEVWPQATGTAYTVPISDIRTYLDSSWFPPGLEDIADLTPIIGDNLIYNGSNWITSDASYKASERCGFPNRTDSTVTFTDLTLTLSIQPVATDFDYYQLGFKYTTTGDTVAIPDLEGLHYIYYDGAVLSTTQNTALVSTLIRTKTLVAIVYWDATNKKHVSLADERHGSQMDGNTHAYLHFVLGTQYISGLSLSSLVTDGSGTSNASCQLGYESGAIADEDIYFAIAAETSPAQIPVWYKSGAAGDWRVKTADDYPVIHDGTAGHTGLVAWNDPDGGGAGIWGLTAVTNNDFVLVHIFATNDLEYPIVSVCGEADYNNLPAARAGAETEINDLITSGLAIAEFKPLFTLIVQTSSSYTNVPQARFRTTDTGDNYIDWRGTTLSPSTAANTHSGLSDLGWTVSNHRSTSGVADFAGFDSTGAAEVIARSTIPTIYTSTSDPDSNDDTGSGYNIGDKWINTTRQRLHTCVDNTSTAARWLCQHMVLAREQTLTQTLTDPDLGEFNNARTTPSGFTWTASAPNYYLTINDDGRYRLTWQLTLENNDNTASRSSWEVYWQVDQTGTGSSYTTINGTVGHIYERGYTNNGGTVAGTVVLDIDAGALIRCYINRLSGTAGADIRADAAGFTLEKIRNTP